MVGPGYDELRNTDNFKPSALRHIFEGELEGTHANGYHYEGVPNTPGSTVPGTETPYDEYGVYRAQVTVNGIFKTSNGGYSTFFSKLMPPQEVVDSINEAYNTRSHVLGNTYEGITLSGMKVRMYLDKMDKIMSAFPVSTYMKA